MAQPPEPPIPDEQNLRSLILWLIGVPNFYITAILVVYGVVAWIAFVKNSYRRASELGGQLRSLGRALYQEKLPKLTIGITTVAAAIIVQVFLIRVSYVLSGNFGTHSNTDSLAFISAINEPPRRFLDSGFLESITYTNFASIFWVALTMATIASTYIRQQSFIMPVIFGFIPFGTAFAVLLFGSLALFADALLTGVSAIAVSQDIGAAADEAPHSWNIAKDFLLIPPFLTIATIIFMYCGIILAALTLGRKARQIWSEIISDSGNSAKAAEANSSLR